jgi:hypothetical protein
MRTRVSVIEAYRSIAVSLAVIGSVAIRAGRRGQAKEDFAEWLGEPLVSLQ